MAITTGTAATAANFNAAFADKTAENYNVLIVGNSTTGTTLVAATALTVSATKYNQITYVAAASAITVSANPQIQAGSLEGQILEVIGTSDTNTVTYSDGTGLKLNGPITLAKWSTISLRWDATGLVWRERYRNDL